ncbi:MAG: tryptophan--tRNA ligase [Candidatus Bipolaricaulia bacterium]
MSQSQQERERVLSGIQPTGELQLGNYFGAVKHWVALQDRYHCFYPIVDYHAITVDYEPEQLKKNTLGMAIDLMASGIDPKRSVLFVQSQVPEHTELAWVFNSVASYGDLTRMTQFKEKSEGAAFVSAGLFIYPILQAADILIYKASKVPVGEDQVQHLELSRRIARRFNRQFGELFPEPEALLSEAPRIMSTADPSKKMSKSLGSKHYIGVMESEDVIWEKIKTAVTDVGLEAAGEQKSPGVDNLFVLLRLTADARTVEKFEQEYANGKLLYQRLKEAVYEHLMATLKPIRERHRELEADLPGVQRILQDGAQRAREIAVRTMAEVRERIGV